MPGPAAIPQTTPARLSLSGPGYLPLKRWLDVCLALILLVICGPLMALIALGIKLHSPGPVLYRQTRAGQGGRPFTFIKFRSMREGASPLVHQQYVTRLIRDDLRPAAARAGTLKLKNDSRITGLGRILRRYSLDELPQLFNVLRGEMSLVGPRPPLPYEVELYTDWHRQRLNALPGLTGLWQVTGRNRVSFTEVVAMDIQYIAKMSLWLDLWIMLKTPLEMLRGDGAG
jgi:lipopolysaccharide/colanic/teichoic acid biosynthesis glycosyltransferase